MVVDQDNLKTNNNNDINNYYYILALKLMRSWCTAEGEDSKETCSQGATTTSEKFDQVYSQCSLSNISCLGEYVWKCTCGLQAQSVTGQQSFNIMIQTEELEDLSKRSDLRVRVQISSSEQPCKWIWLASKRSPVKKAPCWVFSFSKRSSSPLNLTGSQGLGFRAL